MRARMETAIDAEQKIDDYDSFQLDKEWKKRKETLLAETVNGKTDDVQSQNRDPSWASAMQFRKLLEFV